MYFWPFPLGVAMSHRQFNGAYAARLIAAFILSVLLAYTLASVSQSLFVLASLNNMGVHIEWSTGLQTIARDFIGLTFKGNISLGSLLMLGFNDDGSIPDSNPFLDPAGRPSPIWSYGHRHPQGLVYDREQQRVFAHEHGPQGGDELNRIEPGKNYGWPIASFGLDYSGAVISPFQHYPGTENPIVHWTPSLAPSGISQCRGCQWPEWEGDLLIGMLAGQQVTRVRVKAGIATEQQALFTELGVRIRNLRFGPDGALYLITEEFGHSRVLRVSRRGNTP